MVEGASLRSITRTTYVHRTTVAKLMLAVGERMRLFMDRRFRNLTLTHLECDEIWTFCLKKQGKLKPHEVGNDRIGDQYLFVGIDETTKFIPSFVIGKRTKETTELFAD